MVPRRGVDAIEKVRAAAIEKLGIIMVVSLEIRFTIVWTWF
jgi:hypothetical protein